MENEWLNEKKIKKVNLIFILSSDSTGRISESVMDFFINAAPYRPIDSLLRQVVFCTTSVLKMLVFKPISTSD